MIVPNNVDLSELESSPNGMGWVHLENLAEGIAYDTDTYLAVIERHAEQLGESASDCFKVFQFMLGLLDTRALDSVAGDLRLASIDYHDALRNRDAANAELQLLQDSWKEAISLGKANLRVVRETLKTFESKTDAFGRPRFLPILPKHTIFIEELEFFEKYLHKNKDEIEDLLDQIENRILNSSDISLLGPMQVVLDKFRQLEELLAPLRDGEKKAKELSTELDRHSRICTQHKALLVRTLYTMRPLGRCAWYRLADAARSQSST